MSAGRLGLFESTLAMPVAALGPGTTRTRFTCEGNSLISTLFILSIDAGATLKVNWWDTGAGTELGERYDLQSHPLFTGPISVPTSDRQVVARIHNKPVLETVVTGGNATFGVYVTVVSSFASDSDAALVSQAQPVDLSIDKAHPGALYDPVASKWFWTQGTGGIQTVRVTGTVSTAPIMIDGIIAGTDAVDLAYGANADLISYISLGTTIIPEVIGGGDADGEFRLFINGVLWGLRRNSFQERQVSFKPGIITLSPGDSIRLNVTNTAQSEGLATYEGIAYYGS